MLVEFDLLRIGVAEGFCGASSFLEPGFFGTTFFVVDERFVEILESLLEWVDGHFGEPLGLWCVSPLSEFTAESGITEKFESFFLSFVLQGEGFIEDESFGASEAFHAAGLLAVGPCPIFEGLELFHGAIILWSMETNKEIRHGRHCVFKLHVHLVFVTKYRRGALDGDAILRLRVMFAKVCDDFEAELVELNGEDDHVHLLVSYPPKVSLSRLVNSLKGVSSRLLRRERPDLRGRYWKSVLWSPSYFASSCGGAPLSIIQQYVKSQRTPL